ncbi:hypothetical protein BJ875DRAFT_448537 [Amylocarpus encephaloides]|uniref:Uncharacterized protein n=1 Tax=Amylocarpus encephaloides TaxID=45428 RepID=A0A9P7YT65_9HELO|nr:hypothetical protein BJ875DRAFT_448537 [Amylocarpus encephaloides]
MSIIMASHIRTPSLGILIFLILIWTLYSLRETSVKSSLYSTTTSPISDDVKDENDRPLVLYAYADGNDENARTNLEFFLKHGLHNRADFVFILNGETSAKDLIPQAKNIRYVQRSNDCYDMGAYSEVLQKDDLYKNYKRFIMLNASIRGPFMPYYAEGCWSDMYLGRVTDQVKLIGMTVNCSPTLHVQSMILATDITGLEVLLYPSDKTLAAYHADPPKTYYQNGRSLPDQVPGMNGCFHDWLSAVTAEISLTTLLHRAGYTVDVMMSGFHGVGDGSLEAYENICVDVGDILWQNKYYGINIHPFETIFIKSNRNIAPLTLERHSEWVRASGYSSYDHCPAPRTKSRQVG